MEAYMGLRQWLNGRGWIRLRLGVLNTIEN